MKKHIILIGLVLAPGFVLGDLLRTETGFYYPANKKHDGTYLRFGQKNSNYGNRCHLARDYHVGEGTAVYSISEGVVEEASMSVSSYGGDTPSRPGGAVVIKHKKSSGEVFYALYGHLKNLKVKKGDRVSAGMHIGDVGPYFSKNTSLPHLHFGINLDKALYSGYTPTSSCRNFLGFVDPEPFLQNNYPRVEGVFDGAGSLISPREDCYGCNKDIAKMHPHKDKSSTVVFQWLSNDDFKCSYLNIYASSDVGEVIVKKKGWSSSVVQDAYRVNLGKNQGFSISNAIGNDWTLFSITSQKPVKSDISISAKCQTASYGFKDGGRKHIANDLTALVHEGSFDKNLYWMGTGSIISTATQRSGFGVTKDLAIKSDKKDSVTSFQWLAQPECSRLKITAANGSVYTSVEDISTKIWNAKEWQHRCSSIPCTIDTDKTQYYIVKIRTKPQQVDGNIFEAKCE